MLQRHALIVTISVLTVSIFSVPTAFAGGQAEVDPDEPVEIRLATWAGSSEANELQEILDELNEASDLYYITQESSPAEYQTNLQTQIAGGTAADLMWIDQAYLTDFAAGGALLDITDMVASDERGGCFRPRLLFRHGVLDCGRRAL